MEYHYTLFVDEAGDDRAKWLRPTHPNGNSEWLCIGGYLLRATAEQTADECRDRILVAIGGRPGGVLHYRNLKPKNRRVATRMLSSHSARGFVVCSFKQTMVGYNNQRVAGKGNTRDALYNWVCRILLERVTEYVERDAASNGNATPILKIVMASRKGHHFGNFKLYIDKLIGQAETNTTFLNFRTIKSRVLRSELISRAPASEVAGLQLSDTLVSSFFQSIEQSSPHHADETARELRRVMAGRRWSPGQKCGEGVTLFHPSDAADLLSDKQKAFFEHFGYRFKADTQQLR